MTEVEQYNDQAPVAVPAPQLTGGAMSMIREYTAAMADAHTFATAICNSPFAPAHFKGKPEDTALAILYGASVGFDPMTAVQQLYVIGGKPALYSRAMVAVVLSAGHNIWTEDEGDGFVTVAGHRKESPDKVVRVTWTSEQAKVAGYDKNSKYRSDPRSMLYARASGDVARRIAPDALLGLAYNVEEMQLVSQQPVPATRATTTAKDRVRAAIAPHTSGSAAADETSAPSEPSPGPTAESDLPPLITRPQSKKLHALVNELGLDRDAKLKGCSLAVGRDVSTTGELTKDEAVLVIDRLEAKVAALSEGVIPADVADEPEPDEGGNAWGQAGA